MASPPFVLVPPPPWFCCWFDFCLTPAPANATVCISFVSPSEVPASTVREPVEMVPAATVACAFSTATFTATAAPTPVWPSEVLSASPVAMDDASASFSARTVMSPVALMVTSSTTASASETITVAAMAPATCTAPPVVCWVDCWPLPPCPPGLVVWVAAVLLPLWT